MKNDKSNQKFTEVVGRRQVLFPARFGLRMAWEQHWPPGPLPPSCFQGRSLSDNGTKTQERRQRLERDHLLVTMLMLLTSPRSLAVCNCKSHQHPPADTVRKDWLAQASPRSPAGIQGPWLGKSTATSSPTKVSPRQMLVLRSRFSIQQVRGSS